MDVFSSACCTNRKVSLVHHFGTKKVSTRTQNKINRQQEVGGGCWQRRLQRLHCHCRNFQADCRECRHWEDQDWRWWSSSVSSQTCSLSADHPPTHPSAGLPQGTAATNDHTRRTLGPWWLALPSPATHATIAATLGTWRKWSSRVWCCRSKEESVHHTLKSLESPLTIIEERMEREKLTPPSRTLSARE